MLVHPEILPDVLSLLIPAVAATSLAWWRSAARSKKLEDGLREANNKFEQLRTELGIQATDHASRWNALKTQLEQTDLLYRSEEHLANRLTEFVSEATVTLKRQSRQAAAVDSPYGVAYDGERCQPARIRARLDEMKMKDPRRHLPSDTTRPDTRETIEVSVGAAA